MLTIIVLSSVGGPAFAILVAAAVAPNKRGLRDRLNDWLGC